MKLTKQQWKMTYLAYFVGIISLILVLADNLTTRTLPIYAQILFVFAGIFPFIIQLFFKAQNKAHRKMILENRKKLFEEIPKEELFKEDSVFVDTLEGEDS